MASLEIKLGLNEDLVIGREERRHGYGTVVLDDCNFHESTIMEQFEKDRSLSIMAPDGEVGMGRRKGEHTYKPYLLIPSSSLPPSLSQFTLMNYRVSGEFLNSIPFRATATVEDGDVPK